MPVVTEEAVLVDGRTGAQSELVLIVGSDLSHLSQQLEREGLTSRTLVHHR